MAAPLRAARFSMRTANAGAKWNSPLNCASARKTRRGNCMNCSNRNRVPPAEYRDACQECSLFEICLPKATGVGQPGGATGRPTFQNLMAEIIQNTLYLTTHATFVSRDHLTLQVEVPVYPADLPAEKRTRDQATDWRKVSIPIHHLESLCAFGPITVTPPALDLCWEHGVAVNFLSEFGYLQARMTGVADTSVTLRRAQFRVADVPAKCAGIARQIIAGKIQNSRNSLLRAARETDAADEQNRLTEAADALARQIQELGRWTPEKLSADRGVGSIARRGRHGGADLFCRVRTVAETAA